MTERLVDKCFTAFIISATFLFLVLGVGFTYAAIKNPASLYEHRCHHEVHHEP